MLSTFWTLIAVGRRKCRAEDDHSCSWAKERVCHYLDLSRGDKAVGGVSRLKIATASLCVVPKGVHGSGTRIDKTQINGTFTP